MLLESVLGQMLRMFQEIKLRYRGGLETVKEKEGWARKQLFHKGNETHALRTFMIFQGLHLMCVLS